MEWEGQWTGASMTGKLFALPAQAVDAWAGAVGPVAEWVAAEHLRGKASQRGMRLGRGTISTPLTQANRSAGRPTPS